MTFRDEFRFVGPAIKWAAEGGDVGAVLAAIDDVTFGGACKPAPRESWVGANGLEMIVDPVDKVIISVRWRKDDAASGTRDVLDTAVAG